MFIPKSSRIAEILFLISSAPAFVKVINNISFGFTPLFNSVAVRSATTIVFPAPAPAFTRQIPFSYSTTFSCAGVKSKSLSDFFTGVFTIESGDIVNLHIGCKLHFSQSSFVHSSFGNA